MGKRIISQRRGRGTSTYKAHSYRWLADIKYRKYDSQEKENLVEGKVIDLVNSKGHSAPLALVKYSTGEKSYIFAPEKIRVSDKVQAGAKAEIKSGNTLPLKNIPEGTQIYNIELNPGDGGKICRSAGATAKIINSLINEVTIKLPSKKQKKINPKCRATIGVIAGSGRKEKPFIKAGKMHHIMRAKGKLYPKTSGVAMNAVDHPFGSGRGRQHAKIKSASPFAPPGRKVGPIRAKKSGRKKGRK